MEALTRVTNPALKQVTIGWLRLSQIDSFRMGRGYAALPPF